MLFERAQILNRQQNSAELVSNLVFDSDLGGYRFISQNVLEVELVICWRMQEFKETMSLCIEHVKTQVWVDVIPQRLVPKASYVLDLANGEHSVIEAFDDICRDSFKIDEAHDAVLLLLLGVLLHRGVEKFSEFCLDEALFRVMVPFKI